ncbi:bile acid-sensitive ion channel-like [Tachypleus tridentatus]|uniref:bile acid-sensitive ion channel-like n=1 Tax=Tachypleus tridentatus TaxID=6853 RepID=UPI003FCF0C2A
MTNKDPETGMELEPNFVLQSKRRENRVYISSVKRNFASFLKSILTQSSINGIAQMASDRPFCRKFLWGLVFACCIFGFFYQTLSFLGIYLNYATDVEVQVKNIGQVMFPAVTVCNNNRVRKSKWCEEDNMKCNVQIGESNEEYRDRGWRYLDVLSRERRIAMGHQKEHFISFCTFNLKECDSWDHFYTLFYTNCFTFNAHWRNKKSLIIEESMGNRWSVGRDKGLVLLLNVEADEYPFEETPGGHLVVHSPEFVPSPDREGVEFRVGYEYTISVKQQCYEECCLNETLSKCGCVDGEVDIPYIPIYAKNAPSCGEKKSAKMCAHMFHEDIAKTLCRARCGPPCLQNTYDLSVSSYPWPNRISMVKQLNVSNVEEARQNFVRIQILFSTTEKVIYSHRPKYAVTILVGEAEGDLPQATPIPPSLVPPLEPKSTKMRRQNNNGY